jgi:hypothetical protein
MILAAAESSPPSVRRRRPRRAMGITHADLKKGLVGQPQDWREYAISSLVVLVIAVVLITVLALLGGPGYVPYALVVVPVLLASEAVRVALRIRRRRPGHG